MRTSWRRSCCCNSTCSPVEAHPEHRLVQSLSHPSSSHVTLSLLFPTTLTSSSLLTVPPPPPVLVISPSRITSSNPRPIQPLRHLRSLPVFPSTAFPTASRVGVRGQQVNRRPPCVCVGLINNNKNTIRLFTRFFS